MGGSEEDGELTKRRLRSTNLKRDGPSLRRSSRRRHRRYDRRTPPSEARRTAGHNCSGISSSESDYSDDFLDDDIQEALAKSLETNDCQEVAAADQENGPSEGEDPCPICLNSFSDQEIGTPVSCEPNHNFCLECIIEWCKNTNSCPVDRKPFNEILVRKQVNGNIVQRIPVEDTILTEDNYDEVIQLNDCVCEVCDNGHDDHLLLLCDSCDSAFHTYCLLPPLSAVPAAEWYCPVCRPTLEVVSTIMSGFLEMMNHTRRIPRTRYSERVRARLQVSRQSDRAPLPSTSRSLRHINSPRRSVEADEPSMVDNEGLSRDLYTKETSLLVGETTSSRSTSKTISRGKMSASALRSVTPLAPPLKHNLHRSHTQEMLCRFRNGELLSRFRTKKDVVISDNATAASGDLLGSIMEDQDKLYTNPKDILIGNNGVLSLKDETRNRIADGAISSGSRQIIVYSVCRAELPSSSRQRSSQTPPGRKRSDASREEGEMSEDELRQKRKRRKKRRRRTTEVSQEEGEITDDRDRRRKKKKKRSMSLSTIERKIREIGEQKKRKKRRKKMKMRIENEEEDASLKRARRKKKKKDSRKESEDVIDDTTFENRKKKKKHRRFHDDDVEIQVSKSAKKKRRHHDENRKHRNEDDMIKVHRSDERKSAAHFDKGDRSSHKRRVKTNSVVVHHSEAQSPDGDKVQHEVPVNTDTLTMPSCPLVKPDSSANELWATCEKKKCLLNLAHLYRDDDEDNLSVDISDVLMPSKLPETLCTEEQVDCNTIDISDVVVPEDPGKEVRVEVDVDLIPLPKNIDQAKSGDEEYSPCGTPSVAGSRSPDNLELLQPKINFQITGQKLKKKTIELPSAFDERSPDMSPVPEVCSNTPPPSARQLEDADIFCEGLVQDEKLPETSHVPIDNLLHTEPSDSVPLFVPESPPKGKDILITTPETEKRSSHRHQDPEARYSTGKPKRRRSRSVHSPRRTRKRSSEPRALRKHKQRSKSPDGRSRRRWSPAGSGKRKKRAISSPANTRKPRSRTPSSPSRRRKSRSPKKKKRRSHTPSRKRRKNVPIAEADKDERPLYRASYDKAADGTNPYSVPPPGHNGIGFYDIPPPSTGDHNLLLPPPGFLSPHFGDTQKHVKRKGNIIEIQPVDEVLERVDEVLEGADKLDKKESNTSGHLEQEKWKPSWKAHKRKSKTDPSLQLTDIVDEMVIHNVNPATVVDELNHIVDFDDIPPSPPDSAPSPSISEDDIAPPLPRTRILGGGLPLPGMLPLFYNPTANMPVHKLPTKDQAYSPGEDLFLDSDDISTDTDIKLHRQKKQRFKKTDNLPVFTPPRRSGRVHKHDQYVNKLHKQERVAEEVKQSLKPLYSRRKITKDDYKNILKRAVTKVISSKSNTIDPIKIRQLTEQYIKICIHAKKKISRTAGE